MRNIVLEDLNPDAQLISGAPQPLSMMQGIDEGCDAALFVGYHAQAGSAFGMPSHTFSGRVHRVIMNDKPVGELGLNAAFAGHFDVPVVLVAGDQTLVEEARSMLPDVETIAVKRAYGTRAARCWTPGTVHRLIKEAATQAVQRGGACFVMSSPITLRVGFQQSVRAKMAELVREVRRLEGRTIEFTHDDMPTLYRVWRAMVGLAILAG